MFAESEWIMIFEKASDAGGNVRSLGCPVQEPGRPVGLAEPDGSDGASLEQKDFDLGAAKFRVGA